MSKDASNQYMLIFRNTDWHNGLSPEEMQKVANDWMAWFKGLSDKGIAVTGHPLEPEGKIVSGKGGRVVADGPFAESKEAIGGYFILNVASLDAAVAIAKDCPGLPYGTKVEVRPMAEQCPLLAAMAEEKELAQAGA
jgi:hypothetical protein